jgi:hypothetical protein
MRKEGETREQSYPGGSTEFSPQACAGGSQRRAMSQSA